MKYTMKGFEAKCPVCGKEFLIQKKCQWVYKARERGKSKHTKYYCSYTCQQKDLKEHEELI